MRLGIDFGTTRTVVAYADRGNYPILSFTDDGGDVRDFVPSVVAERGGKLFFGFDAAALSTEPGATVVRSFKRLLSDPRAMPDREIAVGEMRVTLGDLLTRYFAWLREAILHRSNLPAALRKQSRLEVVVATPANAYGAQRIVTLDGFRRAGFEVVAMLHEPSAAGFEYTHRHADTLTSRRDQVVVYDLGGGTFDASLVRMRGAVHEVLATSGLHELGGDDFDALLADLVLDKAALTMANLDAAARARLLDRCREAKERLQPQSRRLTIDLDTALGDESRGEITINVSDFYDAATPLVRRTFDAMEPVLSRVEEDTTGLAGLYVVGGASELPLLARALRSELSLGRRVHRSPYPSAAVAIGLAIACDDAAGFVLTDRFSRTFGVFRERSAGQEVAYDPIFTPDTPLPSRGGVPVVSSRTYRAAHNIGHYRFFEAARDALDPERPGDMAIFGDVLFAFDPNLRGRDDLARVPVRRMDGPGPLVEERYAIDPNGIVEVTIRDLEAGYERAFRLGA